MSRASLLRDAVAKEIADEAITISGVVVPVDRVVLPLYEREKVESPRFYVMIGPREITIDQGPDTRVVSIGVGLVGAVPELEGYSLTDSDRNPQFLAGNDLLDEAFESLLGLWTPNGRLYRKGLAEHSYDAIEQPSGLDANMYRERGLWNLVAFVTYIDSEDE